MFARNLALAGVTILAVTLARCAEVTAGPLPGISRVLLVSIDGLRPDLLLRADTPALHALFESGTFTFWARTTAVAVTVPSHVSMLTGLPPSKHRIEWNMDLPLKKPVYPIAPTVFELAKSEGYSTAIAVGKLKLTVLEKPGTLDWAFVPKEQVIDDKTVAEAATKMIRDHAPQVFFVHLPEVDGAGHSYGWGSPEQMAAIAGADRALAAILEAMRQKGVLDSTLVIVSADHGGAGKTHGADDARSRHIPWIASGHGVRRNFDLTTDASLEVRTEDTFATACWVLGIEPPLAVEGRPVKEIADETK